MSSLRAVEPIDCKFRTVLLAAVAPQRICMQCLWLPLRYLFNVDSYSYH
jgi:hypothetical protein